MKKRVLQLIVCACFCLVAKSGNCETVHQAETKWVRVYYVNGHSEWITRVEVKDGHVKQLIMNHGGSRPFPVSEIDEDGVGKGTDFRGSRWEFLGYTNAPSK